jgi:hypothetical protein
MANSAKSFAPINAIHMWTDGRDIFAELPNKLGETACIMKFALHDGGLWKALNLLRVQTYEYAGEPMIKPKPMDAKLALAQSILKKNGVI